MTKPTKAAKSTNVEMNIVVELKFNTFHHLDYEESIRQINDIVRQLRENGQNFKFSLEAKEAVGW